MMSKGGWGLRKCEALILHERDFGSFSQVVFGVGVGETGFEISRSCHEEVRGWGAVETCWVLGLGLSRIGRNVLE